jgi:alkanesulfonate monooxygenase SsuD/methylene tetrahydromethanopterin reductase-like flavin-dependent oxidoreductase (luciferase family)
MWGSAWPNAVPDTEGRTLVDWARRADEAGFSTLGTIGRLVYPNYEELIALAAAAAVTSRIRLTTSILLGPLHTNTALFAKQAASLDRISGGRLVLGLGIGGREDDFAASGLTMAGRGGASTSSWPRCSASGPVRSGATSARLGRRRPGRAARS